MRKFGLIGYPLSHSFSKKFFTEKFIEEHIPDCSYDLYPMEDAGSLMHLLESDTELEGINVTIPHKLAVMPLLNEIADDALEIGAVNCIKISRSKGDLHLKGHNTDAYGFAESLKPLLKEHHSKAIILGNGGAAKAVKYALKSLGIEFLVASRKSGEATIGYADITPALLDAYPLLINTTPLGMSPHVESYPDIPYESISSRHLVYDLVYNPEETAFMKHAQRYGATVKNGLDMLYLQAERSWQIWNS